MFENETEANVDAEDQGSSTPEDINAAVQEATAPDTTSETNKEDPEDKVPFHKHPRWIERDNELKSEREARKGLEDRYAQMEAQLRQLSSPKVEKPSSKFVSDLEAISPEYGKWAREQEAMREEFQRMQQWRSQSETQAMQQQALSTVTNLHDQNKVPKEHQAWINDRLQAAEQNGRLKTLQDLPTVYKSIHDEYKSFVDTIKRGERESYVTAKKESNASPSPQKKGTPVQSGKVAEWSKDPLEARQQLIDRILKQTKAEQSL